MLPLFIYGILLSIVVDVHCKSDYEYYPEASGWFKLHKVTATWSDAFLQCHNEGAVLASPLNEDIWSQMKKLIRPNVYYFIGTHARYSPGQFVSVEGVPLDYMPVTDMFQVLKSEDGECLSTDGYNIKVEPCLNRMPYMCYRLENGENTVNMTECGTIDMEYRFQPTTGSCYKIHREILNWGDAYSMCIAEGGYLVILNNEEEARIVTKMFPEKKLKSSSERAWDPMHLGLRDWNGNDRWLSIHGVPIENLYHDWKSGQPDRTGLQQCGGLLREGTLDNILCQRVAYFVCEKNPENIRFSTDQQGQYKEF